MSKDYYFVDEPKHVYKPKGNAYCSGCRGCVEVTQPGQCPRLCERRVVLIKQLKEQLNIKESELEVKAIKPKKVIEKKYELKNNSLVQKHEELMRLVGEQRAADRRLREPNEATNPIFTATFDFDVTSNDVVSNPPL